MSTLNLPIYDKMQQDIIEIKSLLQYLVADMPAQKKTPKKNLRSHEIKKHKLTRNSKKRVILP